MTHDIDDLLEIIKALEQRIIVLELNSVWAARKIQNDDDWYWEHG